MLKIEILLRWYFAGGFCAILFILLTTKRLSLEDIFLSLLTSWFCPLIIIINLIQHYWTTDLFSLQKKARKVNNDRQK